MTGSKDTQHARSQGGWFIAAGLMLAVMSGWIYVNHDPTPRLQAMVVALAAILSLAWGVKLLFSGSADSSAGSRSLALGGGALLGAVALWLGFTYRLEALGEVVGLAFFAVLAASSGLAFGGCCTSENSCDRMRTCLSAVRFLLMGLGAIALFAFVYLAMILRVGPTYLPEVVGLLLGGFLLLFAGFWLMTIASASPDGSQIRLFVILLGVGLGGLLTLVSVIRGYLWNEQVFRAGVAAWSGDESWRFWTIAYLFLAGLALILGSLSLAFSQVRSSAGLRRTVFGYVNIFSAVLLVIFLIALNVLVYMKFPFTFNWSQTRGLTALSPSTKNLLAGLDQPATAYVLLPQEHVVYSDLRNLLGNATAYTNKLTIKYVNPDTDFTEYNKLATRFKEILPDARTAMQEESGRGVLLVFGQIPADPNEPVPHSFIPERKLYDSAHDFDQKANKMKTTLTFKGELEVMKELDFLAKKKEKRKIFILQGNDELDMTSKELFRPRPNPSYELFRWGLGNFVEKLKKDNYDVKGISFQPAAPKKEKEKDSTDIIYLGADEKKIEIPEGCDTIVIPGPSAPVPKAGIDALERFMDRGGRLAVFLDLFTDRKFDKLKETGLEAFLKKYGVEVTSEFVLRLPQKRDVNFLLNQALDPTVILAEAPAKPETVLAKQFSNSPLIVRTARVIRPGSSTKYKIEPLFVANPRRTFVWADDSLAAFADMERHFESLLRTKGPEGLIANQPIPLAVTVSEGSGETGKPRMVVFGDADFLSNLSMAESELNYDLAVSSLEWMAERGFVGPRPKETSNFSFGTGSNLAAMVWGAFWTMLILLVTFGGGVWLVRRR